MSIRSGTDRLNALLSSAHEQLGVVVYDTLMGQGARRSFVTPTGPWGSSWRRPTGTSEPLSPSASPSTGTEYARVNWRRTQVPPGRCPSATC